MLGRALHFVSIQYLTIYIMESVFITVKFQTVDTNGNWLCYGVMLSSYPSGRILFFEQGVCDRTENDFDTCTKDFWSQHGEALGIIKSCPSRPAPLAEQHLSELVTSLLTLHPDVYFVSDNPGLDLRILNNIMVQYGKRPVSYRNFLTYYQCICTWSFQFAVLSVLGIRTNQIDAYLRTYSQKWLQREIAQCLGPKNIPLSDTAGVLNRHFKVLDILSINKRSFSL